MNIQPLGKPDFGPLDRVCDSALKSISAALNGNIPADTSQLLSNLTSEIRSQHEEVMTVFAKEFANMEAEYNEKTTQLKQLIDEEIPILKKKLQGIPDLIEGEKTKAAAQAAAALAALPVPEAPKPIGFNPGEDLIAQLMSMRMPGQAAASGPRSAGNIWENWKPGAGGT